MPPTYFKIDRFSHHFLIKDITPLGQQLVNKFAIQFIQWGFVGYGRFARRQPLKTFAARIKPKNQYRFHWGQWPEFVRLLSNNGVDIEKIDVTYYGFLPPHVLGKSFTTSKTPYEKQIPVIDYLVSKEPSTMKLAELQTGFGKTLCAMKAASIINTRFILFLKPQFIHKWVDDVKLVNITEEETSSVRGSDNLKETIQRVSHEDPITKAIIVSNRTFQNYIKEYEEKGDAILELGYGCLPHEYIQQLSCGLRIIDEVHLDFHLNFKIDLYTHVEHSISLSATFISDDKFISQMQEIAYPQDIRYHSLPYNKYIDAYAIRYSFHNFQKIRYIEGNNYSHGAFEKSVMSDKKLIQAYLSLIEKMVTDYYAKRSKEGDTCIVYGSSIAFCTLLTEFLKKSFPQHSVKRYVESDPYENLMDSDIAVSTIGSAGTGHDKKGLITVILTTSIRSTSSNIQGFGRLREIADKDTIFVFLTCMEIDKQMFYYEKKMKLLPEVAKSVHDIRIYQPIDFHQ